MLCLTPSVAREVARPGPPGGGALRRLFVGGEPLTADLARTLLDWPVGLWSFYGPTEATVWTAVHRVGPDDLDLPSVPLGHPIANTRLQVLDEHLRPVPRGVPGELFIGGAALAAGYHRRPDLTGHAFLPDPSAGPGERLYRTGDLVVYDLAGRLRFLGRSDGQVKLRGFRIELGEVEAALRRHPAVRDAAAALRRRGGHDVLVGYVVAEPDRRGDPRLPQDLTAALAAGLPAHLRPSVIVEAAALPLTPSGKVDRRGLPEPPAPRQDDRPTAPSADALEEVLCGLWARALGTARVGRDDDLFQLGGTSLTAMRLTDEVNRELGLLLPASALFRAPTAAALAAQLRSGPDLEAHTPQTRGAPHSAVRTADSSGPAPDDLERDALLDPFTEAQLERNR